MEEEEEQDGCFNIANNSFISTLSTTYCLPATSRSAGSSSSDHHPFLPIHVCSLPSSFTFPPFYRPARR